MIVRLNRPTETAAISLVAALPIVSTPVMIQQQPAEYESDTPKLVRSHTGSWWSGEVHSSTPLVYHEETGWISQFEILTVAVSETRITPRALINEIQQITEFSDNELADVVNVSRNAIQLWKNSDGGIKPKNEKTLLQVLDIARRAESSVGSNMVNTWLMTPTIEHGITPQRLLSEGRFDEARFAAAMGVTQLESLFTNDEWSSQFLNEVGTGERAELDSGYRN